MVFEKTCISSTGRLGDRSLVVVVVVIVVVVIVVVVALAAAGPPAQQSALRLPGELPHHVQVLAVLTTASPTYQLEQDAIVQSSCAARAMILQII